MHEPLATRSAAGIDRGQRTTCLGNACRWPEPLFSVNSISFFAQHFIAAGAALPDHADRPVITTKYQIIWQFTRRISVFCCYTKLIWLEEKIVGDGAKP
jgi:hypothetical protein